MGDQMHKKLTFAFIASAFALLGSIAGPALADPPDGDTVMEIHRGGLAYDAQGESYQALSMFGQACEMGLAAACTMAGQLEHELADSEKAHIRAARMFAKACREGDDYACTQTGKALGPLSRANSTEPEGLMTLTLLRMGEECRHEGGEQACKDAAQMLSDNDEIGVDLFVVRSYAERACADGDRPGCVSVAALPAAIPSTEETLGRNEALCMAGFAGGCDALLDPLMAATAGDETEWSIGVLKAACDEWVGSACANLGHYYSQGPEDILQLAEARVYMRKGCDAFVSKACFAFGVMQKKGMGGPVNTPRSVSLVAHACELGHAKACTTLAKIAELNNETEAGGVSTAEALRRACRLGDRNACGDSKS